MKETERRADDWRAAWSGSGRRKLGELREQIDAVNAALRVDVHDFELPEMVVPAAELNGGSDGFALPLLDSRWSFADQCQRLINSKAYRNGATS